MIYICENVEAKFPPQLNLLIISEIKVITVLVQ
jgi:hypothetical protein